MVSEDKTEESLVMNVWPDAGRALNLSRATTYSMIHRGLIPSVRLGKRILIPRKALEKMLEAGQN
jgi:excisionase family DNA binding protein